MKPPHTLNRLLVDIFERKKQNLETLEDVHLSWHVHQEDGSNGSLSLTVTFLRLVESVSFQDAKQILLPTEKKTWTISSLQAYPLNFSYFFKLQPHVLCGKSHIVGAAESDLVRSDHN